MIGKMKKKEKDPAKETNPSTETPNEKEPQTVNEETLNEAAGVGTETSTGECADKDQQIAELNDKYLRLYAEFDNYRRRTQRERADIIQMASSDLMGALLTVLDDFDRAVLAFDQTNDVNAMQEGIRLVQQKFKKILSQKGLEEMKSIGEPFSTDFHEAVANIPAPTEEDKQKVLDEIEKGYFLNGKVIRYARVVVGN